VNRRIWWVFGAAAALALILFMKARTPDEKPLSQPAMTADETAGQEACTLTQCRVTPVITSALKLSSGGKDLIGIWNVPLSSQSTLDIKNVSDTPVVFKGQTLFMCLNDGIVPVSEVPEHCRFMKITKSSCYDDEPRALEPGESCSVTIEVDNHGQIGKLEFDTTMSGVVVMIIAQ
jgi:hypothetical protein